MPLTRAARVGLGVAVALGAVLLLAVAVLVAWVVQARAVLDTATQDRAQGTRPAGVPDTVLVAPPETHQRLYALVARFWDEVLAPAGCADLAWLTSGSLLGWARHQGRIIPWDDDIDVACRRQDAARIVAQAERAGWSARRLVCFYKFAPPGAPRGAALSLGLGGDEIDLFPMDPDGEGVWQNPCAHFARERYRDADLWPLREVGFGPARVRVPRDPVPFLAAAYGGDWATRACGGVAAYHAKHRAMGSVPPRIWAGLAFLNPLLRDVCFPVPAGA